MCECETKGRPVIGMRRKRDRQNGSAAGGTVKSKRQENGGRRQRGAARCQQTQRRRRGVRRRVQRAREKMASDQATRPAHLPHQPVIASFPTTPGHGPPLGSLRFTTYGHKRVCLRTYPASTRTYSACGHNQLLQPPLCQYPLLAIMT